MKNITFENKVKEVVDTNILVVGNGFDLAHGLPTRYMDFMDYLSMVETLYKNKIDFLAHPPKKTKVLLKDILIINIRMLMLRSEVI